MLYPLSYGGDAGSLPGRSGRRQHPAVMANMSKPGPLAGSVPSVELTLQRIGAWSGTVMILLYGASFSGIAQLFPPLSPAASAAEIAGFFVDHKLWIRFGVSGALLSAVLALPFLATIVLRIRRVEGGWGMLSMTQLMAATVFVPGAAVPAVLPRRCGLPARRAVRRTHPGAQRRVLAVVHRHRRHHHRPEHHAGDRSVRRQGRPADLPALVRLPQPVGGDAVAAGLRRGGLQRRSAGVERGVRLLHPRSGAGRLAVLHHRGDAEVHQGRAGPAAPRDDAIRAGDADPRFPARAAPGCSCSATCSSSAPSSSRSSSNAPKRPRCSTPPAQHCTSASACSTPWCC